MMKQSAVCEILKGRWLIIFACILIMSTAGASYVFSIYSSDIKSALGYDQTTLNLLSFSKDIGSNFGIISGLLMEVAPPWVVLSMAAVLNFFGYFMIWLAVEGKIAKPAVWQMCVYIGLGMNSQAVTNTGALIPSVQNFPESRGVVLGLLKGFVGLSGAIITQVYHAVYGDDSKALILMISILPSIVIVVFLKVIRVVKVFVRQPDEIKVFYKILYISVGLALWLMATIILQRQVHFNRLMYIISAVTVTIILCMPIFVVVKEEMSIYQNKVVSSSTPPPQDSSTKLEVPKLEEIVTADKVVDNQPPQPRCAGFFDDVLKPPARGEDFTILQGLCNIDMLIIFLATGSGIGGTITAIDNLGQIGASLGYEKRYISIFVSLVSIWSFFGRVITGFGSEILLKRCKFPRPLIIALTLIMTCVGHLLIALNVPGGVYIASIIIGFSSGAQWPMMYAVISEIFGLKHFATLYNFGTMASPVGSYILNVSIVGYLYDKEARRQMVAKGAVHQAGKSLDCMGAQCYRTSFLVIALAAAFGSAMWFLLTIRTKSFYSSDIYMKFRNEGDAPEVEIENQRQLGRSQIARN
ncbi:hypothetical protein QQ045_031312 [Rhodiola kirilowii]